jgi:hypothetical protein
MIDDPTTIIRVLVEGDGHAVRDLRQRAGGYVVADRESWTSTADRGAFSTMRSRR